MKEKSKFSYTITSLLCIGLLIFISCQSNSDVKSEFTKRIKVVLQEAQINVVKSGILNTYTEDLHKDSIQSMLFEKLENTRVDFHVRNKLTKDCLVASKVIPDMKPSGNDYSSDSLYLSLLFDKGEMIYKKNKSTSSLTFPNVEIDLEKLRLLMKEMNEICPIEL